jgi:hypothetical protein
VRAVAADTKPSHVLLKRRLNPLRRNRDVAPRIPEFQREGLNRTCVGELLMSPSATARSTPIGGAMPEPDKKLSQFEDKDTAGSHGGNRAGGRKEAEKEPRHSSQAAGKDPHRGKGRS